MPDDVTLNPGADGAVVATDEISDRHFQKVKTVFGPDGQSQDVEAHHQRALPVGLYVPDSPAIDAFARIRVGTPETLGAFKQVSSVHNPLLFLDDTAGTASVTHQTNRASTFLTVGTDQNDFAMRQTKKHYRYQPGKSLQVILTGVFGAGQVGTRQRLGLFNAENGLFFQLEGTTLSVVVRSFVTGSAVDTAIPQASWNIDVMDGTGPSGKTLDITKGQIFLLDFQWLGLGRVRFGFFIDGCLHYVHETMSANVISSVYMTSPVLPIRYEIENTSNVASSTTLEQVCFGVMSEGGHREIGLGRAASRGVVETSIGTTKKPVLSIRIGSGFVGSQIIDLIMDVASDGAANTWLWEIHINPTIGVGTAASWTPVPDSIVEVDIARDGDVTADGFILDNGIGTNQVRLARANVFDPVEDLVLGHSLAGVPDELVLTVITTGGSNNFIGGLSWKEIA